MRACISLFVYGREEYSGDFRILRDSWCRARGGGDVSGGLDWIGLDWIGEKGFQGFEAVSCFGWRGGILFCVGFL